MWARALFRISEIRLIFTSCRTAACTNQVNTVHCTLVILQYRTYTWSCACTALCAVHYTAVPYIHMELCMHCTVYCTLHCSTVHTHGAVHALHCVLYTTLQYRTYTWSCACTALCTVHYTAVPYIHMELCMHCTVYCTLHCSTVHTHGAVHALHCVLYTTLQYRTYTWSCACTALCNEPVLSPMVVYTELG